MLKVIRKGKEWLITGKLALECIRFRKKCRKWVFFHIFSTNPTWQLVIFFSLHTKLTQNLHLFLVVCRKKYRPVALSLTHFLHFFYISDSYTPFFPVKKRTFLQIIYNPKKNRIHSIIKAIAVLMIQQIKQCARL